MCLDHGIMANTYLSDNSVFKANSFAHKIHEHNQRIIYCGVNAQNQNILSEWLIRTVSKMAHDMIPQSSI